jgi:hypothetical protein
MKALDRFNNEICVGDTVLLSVSEAPTIIGTVKKIISDRLVVKQLDDKQTFSCDIYYKNEEVHNNLYKLQGE